MGDFTEFSNAGYVLGGGRSSRMGTDKALLPYQGRSLIEHIAEQVRLAAGSVTLVGHPGVGDVPAIPDLYPGFGPVGGLVTALEHSHSEWNLLVACDMPFVSTEWLSALLEAAACADSAAMIPITADGRLHPLCAVYRRSALPLLQQAVSRGIHTVREAIEPLGALRFPVSDARLMANINTPGDWAQAQLGQE
jgi:molybdopterin-guanine dinucleotide biosynthesis protein A